jgi:stage II sporulation protein D
MLRRDRRAAFFRSSLIRRHDARDGHGNVTEVIASGGGNGHGAGMCQVGALAQARAGRPYDEILRSYYTGIDLVKL